MRTVILINIVVVIFVVARYVISGLGESRIAVSGCGLEGTWGRDVVRNVVLFVGIHIDSHG